MLIHHDKSKQFHRINTHTKKMIISISTEESFDKIQSVHDSSQQTGNRKKTS